MALLAELGTWIAAGAVTLREVLDPQVIAIGGGVAQAGPLLMEPFKAALGSASSPRVGDDVCVVAGQLGTAAGVIGAAAMAHTGIRG